MACKSYTDDNNDHWFFTRKSDQEPKHNVYEWAYRLRTGNYLPWTTAKTGARIKLFCPSGNPDDYYDNSAPENSPEYAKACQLKDFLKLFKTIPSQNLPPTSLVREFIGGSSFHY